VNFYFRIEVTGTTHPSDHASIPVLTWLCTPGIFDPQEFRPRVRLSTYDDNGIQATGLTIDEAVFSADELCDSGIFISTGDDA